MLAAIRGAGVVVLGCALALAAALAVRDIAGGYGSGSGGSVPTGRVGPRQGGVLRLLSEAPASLDPRDVDSVYESLPINQLFDGLIRLDPSLNVMPALAQTWTISPDGLVYTFVLRDGVKFHDGSPLTAADVVFSIHRALSRRGGKRAVAAAYTGAVEGAAEFASGRRADIPGVRALDTRTVEIRLRRPSPGFLDVLTLDYLRVVPQGAVEEMGDETFRRFPVGTGPFRFVSRSAERIVLHANREYFLKAPLLEEVHIVFPAAGEVDRGAARFRRGEIEAFEANPDAVALLSGDDGVAVDRFQELSVHFLGLATGHPNFEDPRVRRAVAHAIDREAMVALAPANRRVAHGVLPPGLPGYSPGVKTLAYDPAKSLALLEEARYPRGRGLKPFKIFAAAGGLGERRTFEKLQADLRKVGFPCEVAWVDWAELSRRLDDHDAAAFVIGWVADLAEPDAFLRTLFVSEATANYFDFSDPETTRLLDRVALEASPIERARLYVALERRILGEAPVVPLFHSVGILVRQEAVHGLEPGPLGLAAIDLERVWIEGEI